ncbi:hypothetical protein M8C21_015720 [Ambrosia artemisiifolia]|uniref:Receptor-like serine/threonine-protein kinase n=1 Tax=Ambrosia artemisiifolia TaxID=4212 RepID=A0AAD5BRN6_AMBAR|nr:hypothetical protein M8C21_015720 [Ambrosia artemisiifolia]
MEKKENTIIIIPSMEVLTILLLCFHTLLTCTIASDTLSVNQTIRDGETIVSAEETFELGFFSPSNTSQNRYLGIWYKNIATCTVIWVANRETPISNKSGELTLNPGGLLVLRDSTTNQMIWSSNTSRDAANVVARLLNNSNFMVVDDEGPENFIWQSFDHPTNTIMPDMSMGRNLERGVVTNYSSWKSDDDPSPGPFMVYMDFNGLPQIFEKNGDEILYRLGSWNGLAYSGNTNNQPNPSYRNWLDINEKEISAVFVLRNKSVLTRLTLSPQGTMDQWNWNSRTQQWFMLASMTTDSCERYALCGVYGYCDISQSPNCGCLRGFTPKNPNQWEMSDWKSGCRRETSLDCGVGEGFRKYPFIKLPDTRQSWFDRNMSLDQCKMKCSNECNCTAYATLDIKLGTGCLIWYNELNDMRILPNNGQDIYIRMSATELAKDQRASSSKKNLWTIFLPLCIGLAIVVGISVMIIVKKKKLKAQGRNDLLVQKDGLDLPLFNMSTLAAATNNFSTNNKLGEGGFGPVYKGIARGILYLHQDSHVRIVHRDLKAANILLDHDMNPKISDFGLARSFGGNDTETNTKRVVGTYGYMAPEYAGDGIFSTKSDVYSFGVLVLEIVSGKKNTQFLYHHHNQNLAGHAWRLYKEGKTLELVDESLKKSSDPEVLRSIHIALLCVQHSPEDRPDMSIVVTMLSSDRRLPEPRQPGYYTEDDKFGPENSSSLQIASNHVTITHPTPR